MNYTPFIRRIFAALSLLLFTFSATPKKFLHDILANHKDTERVSTTEPVFYASGFQCHCEDLVVVAPFLPGIQPEVTLLLAKLQPPFAQPLADMPPAFAPHTGVRGPPAAFCS
ncbi:MAG TPA: hypothetical protein VG890_11610 [Puia sp.]|nr:hypothetical protein [Puia sp.]